jgi:phage-related protein
MGKVITWVMLNGATLLGCLQAVVKAVKELLTGVVNLISLFIPAEKAEAAVKAVRGFLNKVDEVIESIKDFLVK